MDIHDNSGSKIEDLLHEIIIRLDKIERQIDDAFYPDESFFRQDYISYIQKQKKLLDEGDGLVYSDMDEFLESLE